MDFTLALLQAAVSAAKRGIRGTRKLSFDYAVKCVIDEMKRRALWDKYMTARRVYFISMQRKTVQEVAEYFGYTWEQVSVRKFQPPASNTGVTPSQSLLDVSRETEDYINGIA